MAPQENFSKVVQHHRTTPDLTPPRNMGSIVNEFFCTGL